MVPLLLEADADINAQDTVSVLPIMEARVSESVLPCRMDQLL